MTTQRATLNEVCIYIYTRNIYTCLYTCQSVIEAGSPPQPFPTKLRQVPRRPSEGFQEPFVFLFQALLGSDASAKIPEVYGDRVRLPHAKRSRWQCLAPDTARNLPFLGVPGRNILNHRIRVKDSNECAKLSGRRARQSAVSTMFRFRLKLQRGTGFCSQSLACSFSLDFQQRLQT